MGADAAAARAACSARARGTQSLSLRLGFERRDIRIAESEMMRDLVHHHVADQTEQVFSGFDPFREVGLLPSPCRRPASAI